MQLSEWARGFESHREPSQQRLPDQLLSAADTGLRAAQRTGDVLLPPLLQHHLKEEQRILIR